MRILHLDKSLVIRRKSSLAVRKTQQGVVLIISLIMLVLMTLIGITGIRLTSTQERMVGYAFDRAVSFQAAESTLREIEARIDAAGPPRPASGVCQTFAGSLKVCGPATVSIQRWNDTTFTDWTSASEVGTGTAKITPDYLVEYLGNTFPCDINTVTPSTNCLRYRITARAEKADERSRVMLQSIYATFIP
jgi:type IV pilus assembly protein PilX